MSRASRKKARKEWYEKQKSRLERDPANVADRRSKWLNVLIKYQSFMSKISGNKIIKKGVVSAVSAIWTPAAGAVAAAAMSIDSEVRKYIVDEAEAQQASTLLVVEELVKEGKVSEDDAEQLYEDSLAELQKKSGLVSQSGRKNRKSKRAKRNQALGSGPGRQTWTGGTPIQTGGTPVQTAQAPTIEPWKIAALAVGIYLVLS